MYTTKKVKADKTLELDVLAHESGRCYSKIVSLMRKVKKKKGFWLSQGAVQKYMRLRGYTLHSQTIQSIIQSYFDSLKSYFRAVKSNPAASPPIGRPTISRFAGFSMASRSKMGLSGCLMAKATCLSPSGLMPCQSMWNCISNGVATISHWSTRSTRHPSVKPAKRLR